MPKPNEASSFALYMSSDELRSKFIKPNHQYEERKQSYRLLLSASDTS